MAKTTTRIEGMAELMRAVNRLGKLPQRVVTPAAKKGANVLLKETKANAPEDTGVLKKALMLKPERSRKKGKKVYQVTFNPAYNDDLVKVGKNGKRSYYPASQEYGYMTKSGGYIPGYHFMQNAADSKGGEAEAVIVKEMTKNVDKEWRKNGG